jgi:hypothetical protein
MPDVALRAMCLKAVRIYCGKAIGGFWIAMPRLKA